MVYPKISIVTPTLNQGKFLEETILSIISQNYPNLEYIIIDGGSTDNSVEIIKKYEKYLIYWVSEKDQGQSDAINKGLKRATGDLFNWINGDDYLTDNSLFEIADAYIKNPNKKVFCFQLHEIVNNRQRLFNKQNNPNDRLKCFYSPVMAQPATFYSLASLREIGVLCKCLHYCMDYELWLRFMFLFGAEYIFTNNDSIAVFRLHPDSKSSQSYSDFVNDRANILNNISKKIGLNDYSAILSDSFNIFRQYEFPVPFQKIDKSIVERMLIYFLLQTKRNIYTSRDFYACKTILKKVSSSNFILSVEEKEWLNTMKKNAQPLYWFQFRAQRKIRHVFSMRTGSLDCLF